MPRHPAPRTPPAPSRPWRAPAPRRCRRSGGRGAAAGEMSWAAVRRTTWRPRRATASCRPFGGGGPPPPPPGGVGGEAAVGIASRCGRPVRPGPVPARALGAVRRLRLGGLRLHHRLRVPPGAAGRPHLGKEVRAMAGLVPVRRLRLLVPCADQGAEIAAAVGGEVRCP